MREIVNKGATESARVCGTVLATPFGEVREMLATISGASPLGRGPILRNREVVIRQVKVICGSLVDYEADLILHLITNGMAGVRDFLVTDCLGLKTNRYVVLSRETAVSSHSLGGKEIALANY